MDAERARAFLQSLPHVLEAEQFGGLIYWLGDKSIGGRMFTLLNLDPDQLPISYPVGPERFAELLERDGLIPAPYMARAHWVAAERWSALRNAEWEEELRAAHALTLEKLTGKTRSALDLPAAELNKLVAERRAVLGERETAKKAAKQASREAAKKSSAAARKKPHASR